MWPIDFCGLSIQSSRLLPEDLEAIPGLVADGWQRERARGRGLGETAERAHWQLTYFFFLRTHLLPFFWCTGLPGLPGFP